MVSVMIVFNYDECNDFGEWVADEEKYFEGMFSSRSRIWLDLFRGCSGVKPG